MSTLGDFEAPQALPTSAYDDVNKMVARYAETEKPTWQTFAAAWNAVVYRWRAMNEHAGDFEASIAISAAPEINERFRQDHDLFVFFTSAVSTVECFFFASYCVASLTGNADFPMLKDQNLRLYPRDIRPKFEKSFLAESITQSMIFSTDRSEWAVIQDMRNVLSHRGTPPRTHYASFSDGPSLGPEDKPSAIPMNQKKIASAWKYTFDLKPGCLEPYQAYVEDAIPKMILDLATFADTHLK